MRIVWEKYKEALIILAYIAVVTSLFHFVARPLFGRIEEKRNYSEEKTADQEITRKKMEELPQLKEKMEVVRREGDALNVFFKQENALALIEKIESLAAETGNGINIEIASESNDAPKTGSKKPGAGEKNILKDDLPGKRYLTMNLGLDGDFNSAMKFLRRLENMDYFSDVISLKFSKSESEKSFLRADKEEEAAFSEYENPLKVTIEAVFYIEEKTAE